MKCSYLVSFLTVVPINGHPLERPVCLSVHGNPWKTLVKKILSSWLSLSQTPTTECLFIKECALTLNQVLRWRPWLSVKFLSGPFYLSLVQSDSYFTYTEVWDKGYMWMDFRFNIRVFEYLCIKSLQVWYFLFHRPNLAHSKDYCMKCSWTKFQGQRLRSKQSPSKWLPFYCSLLIRNILKWSQSQWCY